MSLKPLWHPTQEEIEKTNIYSMMKKVGVQSYSDFHTFSVAHLEKFWEETLKAMKIVFEVPSQKILDQEKGVEKVRWLPQAKLNITHSIFNKVPHKTAIIYQREGTLQKMTYGELDQRSNQVANLLVNLGLEQGDRVAIDMAMNVESVFLYLGIVKAGMVVVSIADSFAPEELGIRLKLSQAKLVFTQDYIKRNGKLISLYEKVKKGTDLQTLVLQTVPEFEGRSLQEYLKSQEKDFVPRISGPETITNILFSSGTTAGPKAIPWTQLTPLKCASDGFYHQDIQSDDVVVWPTNLGWMMGPWLIYASLINGATMGLYDDVPTQRDFGEFIVKASVTILGLVPSIVKIWRNTGCMEGLDFSVLKCFTSTGECSNYEDYKYLMSLANNRPIIEYCGGTEIGGGYLTGTLVQPQIPATFSTKALGTDFVILDENYQEAEEGELFIIPPGPGLSQNLLNRDHHEVYFKDVPSGPKGEILRRHGDSVKDLGGGYFQGQGRADDTMNLGGIKTCSADIERVLNEMPGVVETAAIALSPLQGGPDELIVYAVLREEQQKEVFHHNMQKRIKDKLNPLFKIKDVVIVKAFPRTASNKVMRRVLREEYAKNYAPSLRRVPSKG